VIQLNSRPFSHKPKVLFTLSSAPSGKRLAFRLASWLRLIIKQIRLLATTLIVKRPFPSSHLAWINLSTTNPSCLSPYTYSSRPLYCFVILPLSFLDANFGNTDTHTPGGGPWHVSDASQLSGLPCGTPLPRISSCLSPTCHTGCLSKRKEEKLAAGRTL
jgi:hypothetical protein